MPDLVDKFLIISSSPGGYNQNVYPGNNGKEIWKFNNGNTDSLIRDTAAEDEIEDKPINEIIKGQFKRMSKSPFKPRNKTWVDAGTVDIQAFKNKMIYIMEKINECCDAINELNEKVETLTTQFETHESQISTQQSTGPGPHGSNYQASDNRHKKNLTYYFDSPQGYPVFSFRYRDHMTGSYGTGYYQGTSAQDLLSRYRWTNLPSGSTDPLLWNHPSASIISSGSNAAVTVGSDGYYVVDYSKIDIPFKPITEDGLKERFDCLTSGKGVSGLSTEEWSE